MSNTTARATRTGISVVLVPVFALLLGMISVQSGASIAKTMFPLAGPLGTVALRAGFGTLILCALRPWRVRIPAPSRLPIAVYGVSLGIMNMCFYEALSRLPLGVAVALELVALTRLPTRTFGVLMSIEPAIGALTGLLFLGEKLSAFQWIAITLIILASIGVTASGEQKMPAPMPD